MKVNTFTQYFVNKANGRYNKDSENMTHGDWICANTSLNKKPFNFDRYPFQKQIADDMHPNLDCIKPSQVGLSLCLDTPILTSEGWSTMGELKVGDMLFDEQGKFCNVTYKSPIWEDRTCYEITFCTGEKIVCDGSHRWYVEGYKAFNQTELCFQTGRLPKDSDWVREGVVNTEMLAKNFKHNDRNVFAIPCTKALQTPEAELLVEPYFLGLWLSDGSSGDTTITGTLDDLRFYTTELSKHGYEGKSLFYWGKAPQVRYSGNKLRPRLKTVGVLNNKHIPRNYLNASYSQRLELLQGLLDSDGTITKRGRASFYNTNPDLVSGVQDLIHSLGYKTHTRWRTPVEIKPRMKNGHVINSTKPCAEVSFNPYSNTPMFKLPRKLSRQTELGVNSRSSETFRRRIVDVKVVDSVPTQCITVDSPSHLFLCGKGLIPTHNTELQIRKALSVLSRTPNTSLIYTMPNERMFKRISKARIKPLLDYDKAFRQEGSEKAKQSMDLMRVGTSFLYVTGSSEADATSINADFVFNDEIDLTPPDMLSLFNSRLQGSDHRVNQRFSTPTYEGFGVDRGYARSDQHEYVCKCQKCNHYQVPLFNNDFIRVDGLKDDYEDFTDIPQKLVDDGTIKIETARVVCEKCHHPLDLADYEKREWVAKYPSRTLNRGYRVRPFSTHRLDPVYIFTQMGKYLEKDNIKGFKNTVLGEPHTNHDQKLSRDIIDEQFGSPAIPEVLDDVPYFLGGDIGKTCNLVVVRLEGGEKVRAVEFLTCAASQLESFVDSLDKKYNLMNGLLDRYPYTPTVNGIRESSYGKIVPAHYHANKPILPVNDALGVLDYVSINRTTVLDAVANGIRNRSLEMEGYGSHKSTIETHLQDMVREENEEKQAVWVKLNGNDHFFHALGYAFGAIEYAKYINALDGYVGMTASLSSFSTSGMINSSDSTDIFGTTNLIGFGNSAVFQSDRKIITRHK